MSNFYKILLAVLLVLPIVVSCRSVSDVTSLDADDIELRAMNCAIERMITKYPDTSLQDIYKSCFQDYFGPAHAIASREVARAYIERELQYVDMADSTYFEPCGWRGNYYRVNLTVVAHGILSLDAFADAFYRSAPAVTPIVDEQWTTEWNGMLQIVRDVVKEQASHISRMSPLIVDFTADSAAIAHMLSQGNYVVHHSDRYNELYHPHYRIVRKDIFQKEILPLLPRD